MGKEIRYDAFISYRHLETDKYVAENLHRILENFKLPKRLAGNAGKNRIDRVFIDRGELPLASDLSEPITEALRNSEYLIVICTPQLKESKWCQKEIEIFKKLHGRQNIFVVLAEGEPYESFPEAVLKDEYTEKDENGNEIICYREVEPLAADVRGKNKREIKKKIKEEVLRLVAPMFGLGYDELKQRHREQKIKRTLGIVTGIATVMLFFGIVSTTMALKIYSQDKVVKRNLSIALSDDCVQRIEEGNRTDADSILKEALSYADTAEAEFARSRLEARYAPEGEYYLAKDYVLSSGVSAMTVTPDNHYLIMGDTVGNVEAVDLFTDETKMLKVQSMHFSENSFATMEGSRFIYNSTEGVAVYDVETDEYIILPVYYAEVYASPDGKMAVLIEEGQITIIDSKGEISFQTEMNVNTSSIAGFSEDAGKVVIASSMGDGKEANISVLDTNTGSVLSELTVKASAVMSVACTDEKYCISILDIVEGKDSTTNYIREYKIGEKEFLWESEKENFVISNLDYADESGEKIYAFTPYGARTYSGVSGEKIYTTSFQGVLTKTGRMHRNNSNEFYCVDSKGNVYSYNASTGMCDSAVTYFVKPVNTVSECVVGDNNLFFHFVGKEYVSHYKPVSRENSILYCVLEAEEIAMVSTDSSVITDKISDGEPLLFADGAYSRYGYADGMKIAESAKDSCIVRDYDNQRYVSYDDSDVKVYTMGKEKPDYSIDINLGLLSGIFFSADNRYLVVNYQNGVLDLYDAASGNLLHEFENGFEWTDFVSGMGAKDQLIINTYEKTMIFNSDMKQIGQINREMDYECVGLDRKDGGLFLRSKNEIYKVK